MAENAPETVEQAFARIDQLQTAGEMQRALFEIDAPSDKEFVKKVILLALEKSKNAWTWRFIAVSLNIPESEWPA